ncbi:MAG: hypothetical protein B7Z79_13055 [Thiomonas sp. 20-64-9]|nr:MAG: hypothetical protein B7Z79_13055 [Thiomonas sp. 20-64-9]
MTQEGGLKKHMAEGLIADYPHIRIEGEGYSEDWFNLAYWLCSTLQYMTDSYGAPQPTVIKVHERVGGFWFEIECGGQPPTKEQQEIIGLACTLSDYSMIASGRRTLQ